MVESGVHHGSVLGPILFLIYVDDAARALDSEVAMFVDDMKIWSVIRGPANEDKLQMNLNRLEKWSNRWLLRFNVVKCSILRLGNTAGSACTRGYFLGGAALKEVEAQKDLGVLTTSSLKPSAHCSRVAKKRNIRIVRHQARSKISPTRFFSVSPDQDSLPIYTVCVVGYPKSGKSCLCNRFVCPHPDFYQKVHASVISTSDFTGPVINSEHWLFWGTVVRRIDEETNARFRVVEQTEFVNDVTFCPFVSPKILTYPCKDPHTSSTHNEYVRRSTAVKLYSPNKLRYICTEQLGHEQRYGKEFLPDRELEITGFLLLFDVSQRFHPDARDLAGGCTQDQFSFFAEILSVLLKRKKPLVLVATKRDNVDEQVLQEFHQMLQKSSDFKRVPLIEVSSHCNINVELAFGTIVRLADNKTRFCKIRPLSYQEASRERDEEYRIAREAYVNHVLRCPSEFLKNWQSFMSRYSHQVDVTRFVNLAGSTVAQNTFEQFSELQKTETKRRHMANLPNALRALLPHVGPVTNQLPEVILQRLRTHPAFDSYFLNDDALSDSGSGSQNAINQEQVLDGRRAMRSIEPGENVSDEIAFTRRVNVASVSQAFHNRRLRWFDLLDYTKKVLLKTTPDRSRMVTEADDYGLPAKNTSS
nr:unnamed protein product [Spirometra erinaceieuropaei]